MNDEAGFIYLKPKVELVALRRSPGKPAGEREGAIACSWLKRRLRRQHRHHTLVLTSPQCHTYAGGAFLIAACEAVGIALPANEHWTWSQRGKVYVIPDRRATLALGGGHAHLETFGLDDNGQPVVYCGGTLEPER